MRVDESRQAWGRVCAWGAVEEAVRGETLEYRGLTLRSYEEEGVVLKAEHWSETHVSGHIDAPTVFTDAGGNVQSTGGGGSVRSRVQNWSRFYLDVGGGQESVVTLPWSFTAREGHRLIARYVITERKSELVKLINANTGAWYESGYYGRDIIGSAWLRRLFLTLGAVAAIYALYGVLRYGAWGLQNLHYQDVRLAYLQYLGPVAVIAPLGWLMTRGYRARERAVRGFIARIKAA